MSIIQGFRGKAGIAKETSWGTYVNPAELIPFVSEGLSAKREILERKSLVGKAGLEQGLADAYAVSGNISVEMTYQDVDLLLAAALGGGAGTPTGLGPYTHTIDLADDIGRALSLTIRKIAGTTQVDYKFPGAKINTLSIKGEAKGLLTMDLGIIAKQRIRDTASGIDWSALALSGAPYIAFADLFAFNLHPIGQTDPAGITLSGFELSLDNKLKGDDYTSNSGNYIEEPLRNDKREVTLKIQFPRHDKDFAEALIDWHENETALECVLHFKNGTYEFKIELPQLLVVEPPQGNIGGGSIVPAEATLKAYVNTDNAGSAIANEFQITVVNNRSTAIW